MLNRTLQRRWPEWFSQPEISVADEPLLSKTKYLVGLQCSKALWIHYNDKALLPPIDPSLTAIFEQGHEIGEWAKKLFPDGIDLSNRSASPVVGRAGRDQQRNRLREVSQSITSRSDSRL